MSSNHFERFELPVSFELDTELLAARYRKLQQVAHPDNFVNASDKERLVALQTTTQINEAFQILKNPLTRGQYLLQLYQIDQETTGVVKGDFLIQQLDLREELESIKQQQQLEILSQFIARIEQQMHGLIAQISQQFHQSDYLAAKQSLQQLQFFKRLHEEAINFDI